MNQILRMAAWRPAMVLQQMPSLLCQYLAASSSAVHNICSLLHVRCEVASAYVPVHAAFVMVP